jgi:outer membrane receptor for ferrienterochelin and colicins
MKLSVASHSIVLAAVLFSLPPQSSAQIDSDTLFSMDLQQLLGVEITTAKKSVQKSVDAAAIVEVISQQDIQNFGANNLLEILDRATSIAMSGTFFFPQNSASMRGGLSTSADHHVLLLLNGRPMRDSFTGGENFPFYTAFPIQLIKQIEIIRGPGSVLYGSNAFTGVINVITQNAADNNAQASVTAGSFNTKKIEATGSLQDGELELSAGLYWLKEDGWPFAATDNAGVSGSFDTGENNLGLVFTGRYGQFNFNGMYINSKQDFWGTTSTWSSLNPLPTSQLDIESTRYMVDVGYQLVFDENRYIDTNISYNSQHFSHLNYDSQSKNTFAEFTHHWQINDHIDWLFGGSAWYQAVTSFDGASVAPVPAFSQTWWSLYTEAEFQQSESLQWTLGAQVNKVPDVKANTVPRLGLTYKLSERAGLKINYGEAFRAAYGVETHFDLIICCRDDGTNRGGLRGNPTLEPERISTTDIQYYRYADNYQLNLTLFRSKQSNLIERQRAADNVIDFINRGKLKVSGVEMEYKYILTPGKQLTLSYTHQNNQTADGIDNFTLAANNILKFGYTHKFANNVNMALHNAYFDVFHDNLIRNPNRKEVNPSADAYNMMTFNLHVPLNIVASFSDTSSYLELYAYNLLNEEVYQPEVAGGQINTNPLRGGRSWYLSFTLPY